MRPQENRRYPDEALYFESPDPSRAGELVIDREVLNKPYPEVVLLNGSDVRAVITDSTGEERGIGHSRIDWEFDFAPGDTITRIETSDSPAVFGWTESQRRTFVFPEKTTDSYELQAGDELLLKLSFYSASSAYRGGDVLICPADQPLPGKQGQESWRLEGIITAEDRLVTWKPHYRWLVDLAIANSVMSNGVDYKHVRDELGIYDSLRGHIEVEPALKAFLGYFAAKTGADYFPYKDPYEKVLAGELPDGTGLTDEQFRRYYPEPTQLT